MHGILGPRGLMINKTWNVFFLITVSVIFSLASYMFYSDAQKQKSLKVKKEQELSAKLVELSETQAQIARLTTQRNELESRLNYKVATLEASMKDSDVTIKSQAEKLDSLSEENATLRKYIEDGEKKIAELTRRAQALENEKTQLTAKIKDLETRASSGITPIDDGGSASGGGSGGSVTWTADMDTVDLGKIVVQKASGKAAVVQHVDSLYGFVVINAGVEDGMVPNTVVNILRNKKMIGKAVVQKTDKNVSAAVVLPRWTRGDIKEGDVISRF